MCANVVELISKIRIFRIRRTYGLHMIIRLNFQTDKSGQFSVFWLACWKWFEWFAKCSVGVRDTVDTNIAIRWTSLVNVQLRERVPSDIFWFFYREPIRAYLTQFHIIRATFTVDPLGIDCDKTVSCLRETGNRNHPELLYHISTVNMSDAVRLFRGFQLFILYLLVPLKFFFSKNNNYYRKTEICSVQRFVKSLLLNTTQIKHLFQTGLNFFFFAL